MSVVLGVLVGFIIWLGLAQDEARTPGPQGAIVLPSTTTTAPPTPTTTAFVPVTVEPNGWAWERDGCVWAELANYNDHDIRVRIHYGPNQFPYVDTVVHPDEAWGVELESLTGAGLVFVFIEDGLAESFYC